MWDIVLAHLGCRPPECGINTPHGTHSKATFKQDLKLVVKQLSEKSKVSKHLTGRKHDSFKSPKSSMLERITSQVDELRYQEETLIVYYIKYYRFVSYIIPYIFPTLLQPLASFVDSQMRIQLTAYMHSQYTS